MAIDQRLAKREWRIHQAYTWVTFTALLVVTLILFVIGARFLRPQAMLAGLTGLVALQIAAWIFSRRIVCFLTQCEPAAGEQLERLQQLLDDFLPRTRLSCVPALYISDMDKPNAFAFGSGLLGNDAVAVTRELLELLNDEELRAVLAHECGHLRARDTTLMMLVSILLTFASQMTHRLQHIGRAALVVMLLMEAALYIPKVIAKGISQLREYGADCFAAMMLDTDQPLLAALQKLEDWHAKQRDEERPVHVPLDDLMLSHPKMGMRRRMLERINPQPRSERC